jgi:uncharacterized protein (TIGR02246 family)
VFFNPALTLCLFKSKTQMKINRIVLSFALTSCFCSATEEPAPEIIGLQKAAADFVIAYNERDAAAIAALFIENGEMTDITGNDVTSGRKEILAHYEAVFSDDPASIAIEVDSVRLVAPNLAIEDGSVHFTPSDDESAPPKSFTYSAVLTKNADEVWQIASTRTLAETTDATGHLAALENVLQGKWTSLSVDGVQLDLAFDWNSNGKSISGNTLTSTSDTEKQPGSIRIGWDASKKRIHSWIFDADGGVIQGVWTPVEQGWTVRSEGYTADGETITVNQKLRIENKDTLIWSATDRIIDGEIQPDTELKITRQTQNSDSETE